MASEMLSKVLDAENSDKEAQKAAHEQAQKTVDAAVEAGEGAVARKKAEAAEKEAKLRAEKEKRYNEVVAAYKKFEELRTAYVDDYGYFTFETKTSNNDSFDWLWKSVGLM